MFFVLRWYNISCIVILNLTIIQNHTSMFKTFSFLVTVSSLLLCACGTSSPNGNTAAGDTTGFPPVETKNPNSDYKPAFAGQTRIGGVKTTAAWQGVAITSGLNRPWGVTALPDNRLLVTEKEGTMRIVTKGGEVSEPLLLQGRVAYWALL